MKVTIDNHDVFYSTGKRDPDPAQPNIVFVHGTALDNTTWTLYSRYYARRGYNAYAMDFPGHGHSAGQPLESIEAMADWLAKFMDAVGIDSATLVGHSMGGLVSIETAIRYPDKVNKLALLGVALPMPVAPPFLDAARDNQQAAIDMFVLFGFDYRAQLGGNPLSGINMFNAGVRLVERAHNGVMFSGLNACNNYTPDEAHLRKVKCSSALIIGRDDVMTPYTRAVKLAGQLDNARVMDIPECGHMLMAERPEEVHIALLNAVTT